MTDTDILCTNGVIHVIDKVLVPQWDIVEAAIMNDDFNTLVTALEAADLVDALKGDGPFTVFAPTDDAFAALPEGLLASLLNDVDSLKKVLLYHVVSGKVMAEQVLGLDGEDVETLLGQDVTVTVENGRVFINESEVIITDIEVTNGVCHVIDAVLVPDLEAEDTDDDEEDDEDGELPQTGGQPYFGLGLLALAGGVLTLRKRK